MIEKLEAVEQKYIELTKKIADPEVIAKQEEWRKLAKEHASLEEIVNCFREYKKPPERGNNELLKEASGDDEWRNDKERYRELGRKKEKLRKN